jgi:hypothetical protein
MEYHLITPLHLWLALTLLKMQFPPQNCQRDHYVVRPHRRGHGHGRVGAGHVVTLRDGRVVEFLKLIVG